MAASETVNIQQAESVVNRWLVDFYLFLAIDLLEKKQYNDFFAVQNVFNSVLDRPLESSVTTPTKIRVLEFLSRINEGERLDVASETDPTLSPLELALKVLQSMKKDCPQIDYDNVCASLKDMIVKMFIRNDEFDRAKKALKHLPKSMVNKKAIYMGLINQKSSAHDIIDQIDFGRFREEMLAFCQKLCQFATPFLFKAVVQLIGSRHTEPDDNVEEPEQQAEPEQPCCKRVILRQCNRVFMEKSRLEAGFSVLANETSFARLEEEEEEEQSQIRALSLHLSPSPVDAPEEVKDQLYQRTSDSPLEASPADEPAQMCEAPQPQTSSLSKIGTSRPKRRQYTIAQLVVEPDSPATTQEAHREVTKKETAEKTPDISQVMENTLSPLSECEVSRPVRKHSFKSCDRAKATPPTRNEDIADPEEMLRPAQNSSSDMEDEDVEVLDVLDSSPESPSVSKINAAPQTCSTPNKSKRTPHSKWKQIFNAAKESKEVWSDEETLFDDVPSDDSPLNTSAHRKRKWTECETKQLKEGVQRFGEGNWCKIKAYYKFKDRTNVNLKDRWRTMKKLKMV